MAKQLVCEGIDGTSLYNAIVSILTITSLSPHHPMCYVRRAYQSPGSWIKKIKGRLLLITNTHSCNVTLWTAKWCFLSNLVANFGTNEILG